MFSNPQRTKPAEVKVCGARWLLHMATASDECLQTARTETLLKFLQRGTCCVSTPRVARTRCVPNAGQEREVDAACVGNVKSSQTQSDCPPQENTGH